MKLLSFLLLFIFATSSSGQEKITKKQLAVNNSKAVTSEDPRIIKSQGTSQYAGVAHGLQDRAGNLWFCTGGEGVYRYDGRSFTNFTKKDGLPGNSVWSVLEDKTGKIWFGTGNGICIYNPAAAPGSSAAFTSIPILTNSSSFDKYNSPNDNPSAKNEVWSILQDKTGKFWFGTTDGVYCYDPSVELRTGSKTFTHFLHDDGVVNNSGLQFKKIEFMLEDKTGNIWMGGRTTEGVFRFDGKTLTGFTPHDKDWLWPLFADKAGNIWFNSRNHAACRYDGSTFTDISKKEITGWVHSIAEDKAGNLWFASGNGVVCYDGRSYTHFTTKDGLINNDVFSVTLDRSGKLWVGARGMSLCRYDPSDTSGGSKAFTDFSDKGSHDIRRIFEDKTGNFWFGTNGDGVRRYDPSAKKGTEKSLTYFGTNEGLSGTDVRCIAQDKTGNLWFGTEGGVSKFDGKHFTNLTVKDGLPGNDTWSILIDKTGVVWVGTREGVCRNNPSAAGGANAFTPFLIPAAEENDFSRDVSGTKVVWDIKEDKAGNIWFATNGGGVYRYKPSAASGGAKSLTNISDKEGLCSNFVNCILEDTKGNLWFATHHEGVTRYDPSAAFRTGSKPFTTFKEKEGLCSSEVWTMCEDKTGNIWLSARGNISRYDGRTFRSLGGNTDDHITMVRNYVQSIFEDRKGILWLGCSGGLYRFDGKSFVNLTREWALGEM